MSSSRQQTRQTILLGALALSTICISSTVNAESLGRLFLSPDERRLIDIHPERADAASAGNLSNKNESDLITVNGLVTRSSGKQTIWLNKMPLREGQSAPVGRPVGIPKQATVELALPGQSGTQKIKPGQSYDPSSGTVSERFTKVPSPAEPPPKASTTTPSTRATEPNPADYLPKVPGLPQSPR